LKPAETWLKPGASVFSAQTRMAFIDDDASIQKMPKTNLCLVESHNVSTRHKLVFGTCGAPKTHLRQEFKLLNSNYFLKEFLQLAKYLQPFSR
jgi:hypothetical protein